MKKLIFAAALAFVFASASATGNTQAEAGTTTEAKAQTTLNISGLVQDDITNESLAGATIYLDGERVYSDLDGNFVLNNVKSGKVKLTVSLISYADQTVEVDAHAAAKLTVKLKQI